MAAPVVESLTSTSVTSSSSWGITGPSGTVNVGDLLYATFVVATFSTTIDTPPSGWTIEEDVGIGGTGDVRVWVAYKVAVSADTSSLPQTYTFGMSGSSSGGAHMLRISGVDTTTPIDVKNEQSTSSFTATVAVSSITTTNDDALLVGVCGADSATSSLNPFFSNPMVSGWTQDYGSSSTPNGEFGSSTYMGLAHKTQATAGATGTMTFTCTSSTGKPAAIVVALNAAAGGDTTVAPSATATTVALPAVTVPVGVAPAATATTVALPAATATGETAVSPAAIAATVAMPAATPTAPLLAVPAAIAVTVAVPAVGSAGGPGANPVTVQYRDSTHSPQVNDTGHATQIFDDGHAVTAQENRS